MTDFFHTATGGARVGGDSSTGSGLASVTYFYEYALGGVKAAGQADDLLVWLAVDGSGGAKLAGSALVDTGWETYAGVSGGVVLSGTAGVASTTDIAQISATLPRPASSVRVNYNSGVIDADLTFPRATLFSPYVGLARISANIPMVRTEVVSYYNSVDFRPTLPKMAAILVTDRGTVARVSARLPQPVLATSTVVGVTAAVTARLPVLRTQSSALRGSRAELSAELPHIVGFAGSVKGAVATLSATFPVYRGKASGHSVSEAQIRARMRPVQPLVYARLLPVYVETLVMNAATSALSKYSAYGFNSFAEIGGKYYAARADGLYEIDVSTTDEGAQIPFELKFGVSDFGTEFQKRVSDAYMGLRSEAPVTVSVTVDEGEAHEYQLQATGGSNLEQRRVPIGKGAKGKYWQFAVKNNDGSPISVDSIDVAAVAMSRRI